MSKRFMPKKPEMPEWFKHGHDDPKSLAINIVEFDQWYDKEIRPLFENAVEVYRSRFSGGWSQNPERIKEGDTHKALIINIQPIKEETAEDLLREFVAQREIIERITYVPEDRDQRGCTLELMSKAKAFLEKKK